MPSGVESIGKLMTLPESYAVIMCRNPTQKHWHWVQHTCHERANKQSQGTTRARHKESAAATRTCANTCRYRAATVAMHCHASAWPPAHPTSSAEWSLPPPTRRRLTNDEPILTASKDHEPVCVIAKDDTSTSVWWRLAGRANKTAGTAAENLQGNQGEKNQGAKIVCGLSGCRV